MIALTPTITTLLSAHAPVAIGVSGGEQRYAELMRGSPAGDLTTVQLEMMFTR